MNNKIIGVIFAIFLGVIMVGSVLIPIIDQSSMIHVENGDGSMASMSGDDFTANFSFVDGVVSWSVNDVVQDNFLNLDEGTRPYFMSENMVLYVNYTAGVPVATYCNYYDGTNPRTRTSVTSVSIAVSDAVMNATVNYGDSQTQTITVPASWSYVGFDEGDYRLISVQSDVQTLYYGDVSQIVGCNVSYSPYGWFTFKGLNVYWGGSVYDAELNSVQVGESLYKFTISNSAATSGYSVELPTDDGTSTIYPYFYILPAELDSPILGLNDSGFNLIKTVPLIVLVAILVSAIALLRTRY